MSTNLWEGKRVRLRAIEPSDWDKFHQNDLDSEGARLSDTIYPPRSPEGTRSWTEQEASTHIAVTLETEPLNTA